MSRIFIGDANNKAQKVKKILLGNASGKAQKVKKVFIGDAGGKAQLVWQDFALPVYTGTYVISGNETKGQIVIKTSGTLTLSEGVYDVFAVGGGGGGGWRNCGGGGAGYTTTKKACLVPQGQYTVVVGAGGIGGVGNTDYANGLPGGLSKIVLGSTTVSAGGGCNCGKSSPTVTPNFRSGGYGGSGGGGAGMHDEGYTTDAGAGGSDGSKGGSGFVLGGNGQGSTTRAFSETTGTLYAGGGGGGSYRAKTSAGAGGSGGGGAGGSAQSGSASNGSAGTTNTGSGGGGGCGYSSASVGLGGSGGSGLVIVRWGY